jgi:hypothetical protein
VKGIDACFSRELLLACAARSFAVLFLLWWSMALGDGPVRVQFAPVPAIHVSHAAAPTPAGKPN